jgi:type IV pilus assembly protein PilE
MNWNKRELRMRTYRRSMGMTLIELMVVVAVLGILGTIAVNSYRGYLLRANRTEARMALLKVQSQQEKFFLQNNRYADNSELSGAPPGGLGVPATTPSGYYTISLTGVTVVAFTVQADAAAGQLKDKAACRTLTIDNRGARSPADSTGCWK